MKTRNNFNDIGHQIENLIIDLENEFEQKLQEGITGYKVSTNINYSYTLTENTIGDKLSFRIRLSEGSRTKIKIEFNCISLNMMFKNSIVEDIIKLTNDNFDKDNIDHNSRIHMLDEFNIIDRR